MGVLVMGLEVLTNHIGLDDEGTIGSSVGSFDDITYGTPTPRCPVLHRIGVGVLQ